MSKKIIVPRGLVNPDDTTIIEIPDELKDEPELIASLRPRCPGMPPSSSQPKHTPTPKTYRHITRTVIERPSSGNESESLGLLASSYLDSNRGSCPSRQSSQGMLGPGYFNSTRSSGNPSSLGMLGPSYFDSTSSKQSMGMLGPAYMDSTRNTTGSSMGMLNSSCMDSSRPTNQSSLGILNTGYMDSSSPPQKIIKKTSKITMRSPNRSDESQSRCPGTCNDSSLGMLGSAYLNSTRSNESNLGVMQFSNDSTSNSSLGLLGSQQCGSTFGSDGGGQKITKNSGKTGTHHPQTCPSSAGRKIKEMSTSRVTPPEPPRQNLTEDIVRQLNILEAHERSQIERDLANYQQARRTLVTNTTKTFGNSAQKKKCPSPHPSDKCP